MSVLNYPGHIVFEIYTNQGYIYVSQDKTTQKVEVVDGLAKGYSGLDFSKYTGQQDKTIFLPVIQ